MRDFARRAAADRAAFFAEAAARRSVPAWMLEKDFWVCVLLGELFQLPQWREHLVFKGGTSLSKVFGVIQRFSEDVDLSVSPEFLGMLESRLEDAPSPTQRQKRHKELEAACVAAVHERFALQLTEALTRYLGEPEQAGWNLLARIDEASQSPVVLFRYPAATASVTQKKRRTRPTVRPVRSSGCRQNAPCLRRTYPFLGRATTAFWVGVVD